MIVELLKTILEINGYEVDLVSSGSDALSKLSEKKYSCVITDFVLGDTSYQKNRRFTQIVVTTSLCHGSITPPLKGSEMEVLYLSKSGVVFKI